MGIGPDSVLDPELRVRGIERLRVVDASALWDMVLAHINACVLMMAETAADLIHGRLAGSAGFASCYMTSALAAFACLRIGDQRARFQQFLYLCQAASGM